MGEISFIEEFSGLSISALGDEDAPKGKLMAVIACVIKRRNGEPTYTINQAMNLSLGEINEVMGVGAEETEAEGKDDSSPKSGRKSKPASSSTSE
ncbi:hypothetical protein [Microbacterium oleivorans]|uniref:Uncharacterized protein n=1 Tax=Microbacterium oleivorans TaxID=273677 RepID=A0A4R5YEQ8_9MICO|nr:hypothetical protein [Microbacterium oleivorans]TDL43601.1 hypothetical protein E2R54_10330 [Microbacterium oleivorans]